MARSAYRPDAESVVALEDDLLFVPASTDQAVAVRGNHIVQAADVGVNVEAHGLRRFRHGPMKPIRAIRQHAFHVVLHVAAQARPYWFGRLRLKR